MGLPRPFADFIVEGWGVARVEEVVVGVVSALALGVEFGSTGMASVLARFAVLARLRHFPYLRHIGKGLDCSGGGVVGEKEVEVEVLGVEVVGEGVVGDEVVGVEVIEVVEVEESSAVEGVVIVVVAG